MVPASHLAHFQRSRQEILEAIGEHPDLVFVRGFGNRGDDLIWSGTRHLLGGLVYREIGIDELPRAKGQLALICGGGAFCRAFHELMPHVLAMAELRFEQVIVLPSSFDTSVDAVRAALSRSRALVFARERESYLRIQALCDARIAHDCAFFFDFEPYRTSGSGSGVLNAFRTDAEAAGRPSAPPDSDDISVTCASLEAWLNRIAAHERVRTDRAHVMIAAAMLGKTVQFTPGTYFKVPAIAEHSLKGFPVTQLPVDRSSDDPVQAGSPASARIRIAGPRGRPASRTPPSEGSPRVATAERPTPAGTQTPRVTVVTLCRGRPAPTLTAIDSAIDSAEHAEMPVDVLVIDNNCGDETRQQLTEQCATRPAVALQLSDRDLGRCGGHALAVSRAGSELVLLLEAGVELLPEALTHLVSELDRHPDALAVTATLLADNGYTLHSGGWYRESSHTACFTLACANLLRQHGELPPSGPCDWLPSAATLVRREIFEQFPLDPRMGGCEDAEWSLRVARAVPGSLRRSREALATHRAPPLPPIDGDGDFLRHKRVVEKLAVAAHFHRRHGRLLQAPDIDVFALVPGLDAGDTRALAGTQLLMELGSTHSVDWLLMQWINGGLQPLLSSDELLTANAQLKTQLDSARAELDGGARQLDHAGELLRAAHRERDEAVDRLQLIYASRLWSLGASYDRARRRMRALTALGGRS